jgi:mono/diheme cytochrome c family protein
MPTPTRSRTRKILRVLVTTCLAGAAALVGVIGYCAWDYERVVGAPYPEIRAEHSPAAVARGAAIFHSTCEVCHRGTGSERATGAALTDAPEFLGTFHSSNLTSHPTAGIGALDDKEIARAIRYAVDRHGRRIPMPSYGMGDADVAALLGFLRSNDPLVQPDPTQPPHSKLSALGATILTLMGASQVPDRPSRGIAVPTMVASVEYGRYLAHDVYDCVGCHTPGYSPDKGDSEERFSGGLDFRDPSGSPVYSRNLTPDETGIAHYRSTDLARALREGVRPDGTVLSSPMPLFRGLDDVEIEALYVYLRSLPRVRTEAPASTPSPVHDASRGGDPAARFKSLGCTGCHGTGAAHRSALSRATHKPALDLARWIRNPERTVPGTPMPTYASLIDEAQALELAEWLKHDGPERAGL